MHALAEQTPPEKSALQSGLDALVALQRRDGSFEGECVWCPMLTAQYAIAAHIMDLPMSQARRDGMLRHFESSRDDQGLWGLHPHGEPSLFVTTLVYVAARLLGAHVTELWLQPARRFFQREGGVERIPTWGKAWLALLGLYDWDGVNPILPEAWALPSAVPIHPSNYYCHTRLIYLGLAVLYGTRFAAPDSPVTEALRAELYVRDYDSIDFSALRNEVREADAPFEAHPGLRALFGLAGTYERFHIKRLRHRLLDRLRDTMRRDLRVSSYLSLSPVNGLLTMLALFERDPDDPALHRAIERFDAWFWEDADEGSRVAGAGSVCWDTSFTLQALAAAQERHPNARTSAHDAAAFLTSQQIGTCNFDPPAAYRIDPTGGWCFSEVGHGWPVSDCTAEALLGLLHAEPHALGRERVAKAVRFILRCQNHDGGFGSYEPSKTRAPLEWMNPAEMFGRCMTERSYVECTASCVMALAEVQRTVPGLMRPQVRAAIERATEFLRDAQNADGTWDAAWGVHYVYATMFGVRALLAAGVDPQEPRIRRACLWLRSQQREDGAWGERSPRTVGAPFEPAPEGSAVQTAWALITLVEADDPDAKARERAARYLERTQLDSGEWPDGEWVGVFFETALLNYRLYRQYFPVMALALHERAAHGPSC